MIRVSNNKGDPCWYDDTWASSQDTVKNKCVNLKQAAKTKHVLLAVPPLGWAHSAYFIKSLWRRYSRLTADPAVTSCTQRHNIFFWLRYSWSSYIDSRAFHFLLPSLQTSSGSETHGKTHEKATPRVGTPCSARKEKAEVAWWVSKEADFAGEHTLFSSKSQETIKLFYSYET